jgi:hypothetical protein
MVCAYSTILQEGFLFQFGGGGAQYLTHGLGRLPPLPITLPMSSGATFNSMMMLLSPSMQFTSTCSGGPQELLRCAG